MSFANMTLYNAVIPEYHAKSGKKGQKQKVIRADDPANSAKVAELISKMV